MSYIRSNAEEKTGFQISAPFHPSYACRSDFVMVYALDETTAERIRAYRDNGYTVHLMVGIAWGHYQDYLNGEYDGKNHWDEAQTDRFGNPILHGESCPYMVPTVAFSDYLTEKLKGAVDAGIEAIHVEEPEFWERAGYSAAFRREYEVYYRSPWCPAYESVDAMYRSAKLKAHLYARTIDRVSAAIKEYAMAKYGQLLRFYVPTHSLLNYTQWKIVSPEGKLADIPGVDGCIAQVWTGTSREKNWYNGECKERTFETAYLEYGVMQELVKGTGRKMWFLHDPIEDNPQYDWTDYRINYLKTVAASLLHPKVASYEICPWPSRVFAGKYPAGSPNAEPIPPEYNTLLNNLFQTLGDMEAADAPAGVQVGILMSDSQLYQRSFPDSLSFGAPKEQVGTVLTDEEETLSHYRRALFQSNCTRGDTFRRFVSSNAFPQFFSLAMPLLKHGLSVTPVLLDNARRYNGYLDDFDVLLMSYEFMKPDFPDSNQVIANWVKKGGVLCYIGDGSDPYHGIKSWWSGTYPTPAEHLFEALGIVPTGEKSQFRVGAGTAAVWRTVPAMFGYSEANAAEYRSFVRDLITKKGFQWEDSNVLRLQRGPYLVASVLEESVTDAPCTFSGLYADLFTPDFRIVKEKTVSPGESALLYDLSVLTQKTAPAIIGTSVRIHSLIDNGKEIALEIGGMEPLSAYIRLFVPRSITEATIDGEKVGLFYDEKSKTALISFESRFAQRKLVLR